MNINPQSIIPVTEARSILGDLYDKVQKDKYIIFTKAGRAKAALVDVEYLQSLEEQVSSLLKTTFLNKDTLPYTRDFTDKEVKAWQEEDVLV
jgi:prevent-host-death family protein